MRVKRAMSNQTLNYFLKMVEDSRELTKKEREILKLRLEEKTLEEIGKKFHVTAERIRQIEEKGLLRMISTIKQLFLFDK